MNMRMDRLAVTMFCAASAAALFQGCDESADSVSGDSFYITPASVVLTTEKRTAIFQAAGDGIPPFAWSVSDAALGTVSSNVTANTVTYTRKDPDGANIVRVKDSRGYTASATVLQQQTATPETPDPFTVTPTSATLSANGNQLVLKASGGAAPYTWTVLDISLGHLQAGADSGPTVVYVRDNPGDSSIRVTDSHGSTIIVLVSQP